MSRALWLSIVLILHCTYLADRYNAAGAEQDMPRWLGESGVAITEIECEMLPSSREFTCVFAADPQDFKKIPAYFPVQTGRETRYEMPVREPAGCQVHGDFSTGETDVYHVAYSTLNERPAAMGSFTYLELIYRRDLKKACLRSAYGYG